MKISVVCKTVEWQVERLKEEAKKLSVDLEVLDIPSIDAPLGTLGEVVLWRSSSLGGGENRFQVMNKILKRSTLINRCLALLPQTTEKYFQQEYVQKKTTSINCIPTFRFQSKEAVRKSVQEKILHLPFIIKPNKGSKGEGVALIKNIDDLDHIEKPLEELVFQNFIKNSGDYRVLILGGRVLGVIKRTAKEGNFLNNISKGGAAEMITDPKLLNTLRRIATTVASIFELTICGVDIIYDDRDGLYYFLEVNTVPQWKGFQEATGINVAQEIILFCKRLTNRNNSSTQELVREEYGTQIHLLSGKKFHFLSRAFLWTGDASYKKMLSDFQENYIGRTESEHETILRKVSASIPEHGNRMAAKEERMEFFVKYPTLEPALALLFKNLFAKKIYNIDLRPLIKKIVDDDELLTLKQHLENDEAALRVLSTHALNYLYLLEFYLGEEISPVNPEKYLRVGSSYSNRTLKLQLYFFTHCIIGASRFYSEKINGRDLPIYIEMLKISERIIAEHFQEISLDNKFEFLVCARLCEFSPSIENEISQEADLSLSPDGNFLIDTQNKTAAPNERNDFLGAEHRNVLFIMSQVPFRLHVA